MNEPGDDAGAIAFGEKLLTVLGEGRYTATYKYAVLLGVMDLCLEYSTRTGAAPSSVTTVQLAEKVLDLYWSHTRPFAPAGARVLRQNSTGQAAILTLVHRARARSADPSGSLMRFRASDPGGYSSLVRQIEWKLVEMPLPRLQVIGGQERCFICAIGWNRSVSRGEFNDPTSFDNLIRFSGRAGDHLVLLHSLLRPLIHREWAALVARFNRLPDVMLEQFLFGVDRTALASIREPLRELAGSRCFYCDGRIRTRLEVDHFIPWSRYPDNGLENLVVTDPECNSNKLNHLAAARHVESWSARAAEHTKDFAAIAEDAQWEHHPGQTAGVARSIYLRLPIDAMLWDGRGAFVVADRAVLARAFMAER